MTDKYIEMLIKRDKAKPLVKSNIIVRLDGKPHGKCPVCDLPILFDTFEFCPSCGQRLDQKNWAL